MCTEQGHQKSNVLARHPFLFYAAAGPINICSMTLKHTYKLLAKLVELARAL